MSPRPNSDTMGAEPLRIEIPHHLNRHELFVPALKDLCVKVVAENFVLQPSFGSLDKENKAKVVDLLSLELPLELVGPVIEEEVYWKRRSQARWSNLELSAHGDSWKQLYFEKNLANTLEDFDPVNMDLEELKRLLAFSSPWVYNLNVKQLPSHMDLQVLLSPSLLSNLFFLKLTYGRHNVGMDYEHSLFGMKLSDCVSLARALEWTETLTYLNLSSNLLDDDRVKMIASGIAENKSISHLDLSHNKIADRGVKALASLLDRRSVLVYLNLRSNQIHSEGGRAIARALRTNRSLLSLNLSLNRIGDDGCKSIIEAATYNESLTSLNLSATAAGEDSTKALGNLVRLNATLTHVDASCNDFGEEGGAIVSEALETNKTLHTFDVRMSNVGENHETAITEMLKNRVTF